MEILLFKVNLNRILKVMVTETTTFRLEGTDGKLSIRVNATALFDRWQNKNYSPLT